MENKEVDYYDLSYAKFSKDLKEALGKQVIRLTELEPAAAAGDEEKAAKLQQDKAKLDQQIAGLMQKKAAIQKQLDAIEKK